MNKGRKEAEKVKNDIEDVQEELEQHAEEIQTGNIAYSF
jgi:DNA-binding protein YbaB